MSPQLQFVFIEIDNKSILNDVHVFREATEMQREKEIRYKRAIFVNVFQIVLVIAYCMTTFLLSIALESNTNDLSDQMARVPWTDPSMGTTNKIESFFEAREVLDFNLTSQVYVFYMGLVMMSMLLIQILTTTAIHPRLGVLVIILSWGAC